MNASDTILAAPFGLETEYRTAPVGLDTPRPRLAWRCPRGLVRQTAYEIDAGEWRTGRVASSEQNGVEWAGPPLRSSQRVQWRVRVWDESGRVTPWSETASFVMGVLSPADWQARWIGPNAATRPDVDLGGARWITAPGEATFSRRFSLNAAPGEPCELALAARNAYCVALNGVIVADARWEQVHSWRLVRAIDVSSYLHEGDNEIVAEVTPLADEPAAFLASLSLPGGGRIVTDGDWEGAAQVLGALRDVPWGRDMLARTETASPAFEKSFIAKGPVAEATLHITGLGFYEASLNGARIGDKVLDPAPTAYDKRVLYSTYTLDGLVKPGPNVLRVLLGHGWYDQRSIAAWNFDSAPWRDFPRLLAQLELRYADGSTERVVSDASWLQVASPVGYDCIREGEIIGARDPRGPNLAAKPLPAEEVAAPRGVLAAEAQPGARVVRDIPPAAIWSAGPATWIVDFGENIAGWARVRLRGLRPGDIVSFTYDERVAPGGLPAEPFDWHGRTIWTQMPERPLRNIDRYLVSSASYHVLPRDAAFQRDRFVSSGAPVEDYEPRFTYNGFQYLVIRGLQSPPRAEDVVGRVVSTDFPTTGRFTCSDATFNALVQAAERAYRSNFADGFPTDCPHREKNGWTGDAQIASGLAQYFFDNTAGYEKWLADIVDAQRDSGEIPGIVPTGGWGFKWGNGPGYDFALPIIAWRLYLHRGDRRILDVIYPALTKLLAFTAREKMVDDLVDWGIPDWIPADPASRPKGEYTSSLFFRAALEIAAKIAGFKGLADDARRFSAQADRTRAALRAKYLRGDGLFENGSQTAQAMALQFGLAEPGERPAAERRLVEAVHAADDHVTCGIYGMTYLFRALSEAGRTDLAFRVLTRDSDPSPARWIAQGATTLWEDFKDGQSRNHIMFGDFAAWAFAHLAGIRPLESAPGGREMLIAPCPIAALEFAEATVGTPYGTYASAWRREGGTLSFTVTVPPNASAIVRLPGREEQRLGPGTHTLCE